MAGASGCFAAINSLHPQPEVTTVYTAIDAQGTCVEYLDRKRIWWSLAVAASWRW